MTAAARTPASGGTGELVDAGDAAAAGFAADALDLPTVVLTPIRRGANARVWRVDDPGSDPGAGPGGRPRAVLKRYPPADHGVHDRLASETGALQFLADAGEDRVPRLLDVDPAARLALLSFVPGAAGPHDTPAPVDMEAATAFVERLHCSRTAPDAAGLPMAAGFCLSWREILNQVDARHARLAAVAGDRPGLENLLDRLAARRDALEPWAADRLGPAADLPRDLWSLSPSDFGFHNSVRDDRGDLVFLDFEYFGWDDPAKLAVDTELHPAMRLPAAMVERWHRRLRALYGAGDPDFANRVAVYRPLLALRWTCILLNEFLPERWRRRQAAGITDDLDDVLQTQLQKAEGMFEKASVSPPDARPGIPNDR